jgi:hypothetical protein
MHLKLGILLQSTQSALQKPVRMSSSMCKSVLLQVHSLFHSEFYTECAIVLPILFSNIHSFFMVIQLLLTLSSSSFRHPYLLPSAFPSVTCFARQFLRKMWAVLLTAFIFVICMIFSLLWLYVILFRFSHDRSRCYSPFLIVVFPCISISINSFLSNKCTLY